MIDRGELPAVRVGSRRVRVRQSDLDQFLKPSSAPSRTGSPAPQVDEGAVIAWAMFCASMAEATAALEQTDQRDLVRVLDSLARATRELANALRT